MNTIIYTLSCPLTKQVKYIGATSTSLKMRLSNHLSDKEINLSKVNWIKNLKSLKLVPIIEEIEVVDVLYAKENEEYWINQFCVWGFDLYNIKGNNKAVKKEYKRDPNRPIKIQTSFWLNNELFEKLKIHSTEHDRSIPYLINYILKRHFNKLQLNQ